MHSSNNTVLVSYFLLTRLPKKNKISGPLV